MQQRLDRLFHGSTLENQRTGEARSSTANVASGVGRVSRPKTSSGLAWVFAPEPAQAA